MKQKDIGIILVVAIVAGVFSLVATNLVFTPKSTKGLKAQKIDSIQAKFQPPDKRYFNPESINPTQLIQIGDSTNNKPL